MSKGDMDRTWLRPFLRQGLERVSAPDDLWHRVVLKSSDGSRHAPKQLVWMLAAASALTVSVVAIASNHFPPHAAVAGLSAQMEFSSNRISDVRDWVRKQTGVDLPLNSESSTPIQSVAAKICGSGAIEIRYRIGTVNALLVVSRPNLPLAEHVSAIDRNDRSAKVVAWRTGEHAYTLTSEAPEGVSAACAICHAQSTI